MRYHMASLLLPHVCHLCSGSGRADHQVIPENEMTISNPTGSSFGGPLAGLGGCVFILLPPSMMKNISSPD